MKVLVALIGFLAAVQSIELEDITAYKYHERFGIPNAQKIRQAESAWDFDGSRIIGGHPSSLGNNPHLGGLVIDLISGWTAVCGSSLVSNTRLVTAAHCWNDGYSQAWRFTVVLGSLTLFEGGVRIVTSNVQMHENWAPDATGLFHNDIAVITIGWVGYTNNILPINLASGSNDYVNTWAVASGYGVTSDSQSSVPRDTVQMQVSVQVISNTICMLSYGPHVIHSTICTSGSGIRGTCGGDSGGPLDVGSGSSRTLIGVTNFGNVRCEAGSPSAFARISAFNSWIRARL